MPPHSLSPESHELRVRQRWPSGLALVAALSRNLDVLTVELAVKIRRT